MGKYAALFDDAPDDKPAPPAAGKYAGLFDDAPTPEAAPPVAAAPPSRDSVPPSGAASEPPKPSLLRRAAAAVGQPFKDIWDSAVTADRAVGNAIVHPIDTFNAIRANPGATLREGMRGVNDNIPLANRAVEAMGGPPAESPEDAAAAPSARAVGGFAGLPAANMVGGLAARGIEAAAPVVGKALKGVGETARDLQASRTADALETKVNKRTRANLRGDAVRNAIADTPELRKAAGNDAKVSDVTEAMKEKAGAELNQIYTESAGAREVGASDLKALEQKAKAARARADAMVGAAPDSPASVPGGGGGIPRAPLTPSQLARMRANPEAASWEGHPNAEVNPLALPTFDPIPAIEGPASTAAWSPRALALDEANAEATQLENEVAAKRKVVGPGVVKAPPVDTSAPVASMDRRIAALKSGTSSDAAVAKQLQVIRDEFQERVGARASVSPQALRAEQSDFQKKGYGKSMPGDEAGSARIAANREASKAVGDAVVEHVTGMSYADAKAAAAKDPRGLAARLFKANQQIEAANKIDASIADRANRAPGPSTTKKVIEALKHPVANTLGLVPKAAGAAGDFAVDQAAKLGGERVGGGIPAAAIGDAASYVGDVKGAPPAPPQQNVSNAGKAAAIARLVQMARQGASREQLRAQAQQDGTPVELADNIAYQNGR